MDASERLSCDEGAKGPRVHDRAVARLPVIAELDGEGPAHRRWALPAPASPRRTGPPMRTSWAPGRPKGERGERSYVCVAATVRCSLLVTPCKYTAAEGVRMSTFRPAFEVTHVDSMQWNPSSTGKRWTVRYREPGGRSARQREKSFGRKRDAVDFATKAEHDKRADSYIDPEVGKVPLHTFSAEWLTALVVPDGTWESYKRIWRLHVLPTLGRKLLSQVSPAISSTSTAPGEPTAQSPIPSNPGASPYPRPSISTCATSA